MIFADFSSADKQSSLENVYDVVTTLLLFFLLHLLAAKGASKTLRTKTSAGASLAVRLGTLRGFEAIKPSSSLIARLRSALNPRRF